MRHPYAIGTVLASASKSLHDPTNQHCHAMQPTGPAQLDFTVGSPQPISEGHSFHLAGAPYKYLYGGVPYKSPKIAENSRKSELQADLRGSLILLFTIKSSCADPDTCYRAARSLAIASSLAASLACPIVTARATEPHHAVGIALVFPRLGCRWHCCAYWRSRRWPRRRTWTTSRVPRGSAGQRRRQVATPERFAQDAPEPAAAPPTPEPATAERTFGWVTTRYQTPVALMPARDLTDAFPPVCLSVRAVCDGVPPPPPLNSFGAHLAWQRAEHPWSQGRTVRRARAHPGSCSTLSTGACGVLRGATELETQPMTERSAAHTADVAR
jgi:hypothetical protein